MYETTKKEREEIIKRHACSNSEITELDMLSDNVRKGIPIGLSEAIAVIAYQEELKEIRKANKKWWQLWK